MVQFNQFFLYSLWGWVLEVFWVRLTGEERRDRKCLLLLPLCPMYGAGAVLLLTLPPALRNNPPALFAAGGLLAGAVEYAAALLYEKGAGVRLWDYSGQPGNLSGRVCPLYTLLWGLLALVTVYGFHPLLAPLIEGIPSWVTLPLFLLTGADSVVSLCLLHATGDPACLSWYRRLPPRRANRESG